MLHNTQVVEINGIEYTVVVTHNAVPTAPITVYINEANNAAMGDYVYTIKGTSATLSGEENVRLSRLLEAKFGKPVYVGVNGQAGDVVAMFKVIQDMIGE
ncbi:uncharacterized protein CANTADRAFT_46484 [Suhomyces tanzawaensis NRRL Y-17324]|uniref:Uncharacterized protein n=1 Tax=Suhomyces tanzawaensis NRRL Y-17324 TaxID=984487 RepID=A0A1E4SM49_9ASCO|nr:uncharacterized protein CANTADRAFT_46484 [Suhomyces tanzawaensis NRRL Y-17324]ODV80565.1 hypothetical protein CANTADRAFT_46484 [Suhomyces tanzawaensis NRRL Y-17324]